VPGAIRSEESELAAALEASAQLVRLHQPPSPVSLPVVGGEDSATEDRQVAEALAASVQPLEYLPAHLGFAVTRTMDEGGGYEEPVHNAQIAIDGGGGLMEGFPNEDLRDCLGNGWDKISGCGLCLVVVVLICVLVPTR